MTSRHQSELRDTAERDGDDRNEMEAVEALAALARCSAGASGLGSFRWELVKESTAVTSSLIRSFQDETIAALGGNTSSKVTSALNTGETFKITPSKLCNRSCRLNSATKSRQNLTEAEKEARRLRRVLANRESARQTIRRRQAMHLTLTRNAADLSEENDNLKKEKELAVKEYNSMKYRNEFLKLQMANAKKAESKKKQEHQKSSHGEIATSATICPPIFLYNQPSSASFFWPFVYSDIMSSSQSCLQRRDASSLNLGQETIPGINGPGNPLFVLPVPWFLPIHSLSDTNERQNEIPTHRCSMSSSSDTLFIKDNHELSSNLSSIGAGLSYLTTSVDHHRGHHQKVNLLLPEKLSCIRPVESIRVATNSQDDNSDNLNAIAATEHVLQRLPKKDPKPWCYKRKKNVFAATEARKRRKEVMKLKNICYLNCRTQSAKG